jgi:hypothetical protein
VSEREALGARRWLIPDGYLPQGTADGFDSHEAICMLNTGGQDAELTVTVCLEDAPPLGPFRATVPAQRTRHLRTDQLETDAGERVPHEVPSAVVLISSCAVSVQHSRMDMRSTAMALMTMAAIPAES